MLEYSFIGLALILAVSFIRKTPDKYDDVCVAIALPITLLLLKPFGFASGHLRPVTMDSALRSIDLAMSLDGFALSRFVTNHRWTFTILKFIYDVLPLALAIAWVVSKSKILLRASVIGVFMAFPLYILVPAAGPAFAFADWPQSSLQVIQPDMYYPRNCFPSMHLTWALLLALNTKGNWRWIFGIYSALMSLATIAGGQHYFIDLLVALPFTLGVQAISQWNWNAFKIPLLAKSYREK